MMPNSLNLNELKNSTPAPSSSSSEPTKLNLASIQEKEVKLSSSKPIAPKKPSLEPRTPITKAKKEADKTSTKKTLHSNPSLKIIKRIGILGILTLLIIGGIFFVNSYLARSRNFYKGAWKAEIEAEERQKGISEIQYQIESSAIKQVIKVDNETINATITLLMPYTVFSQEVNRTVLTVTSNKIESLVVDMKPAACSDQAKCAELKNLFETNFKTELNENFSKSNKKIIIEKYNNQKILYSYDIDGNLTLYK